MWALFVRLIQRIWETGGTPQQMVRMIVLLLPKGGGDYRGIGLLEPFWKAVEVVIDKRMQKICFHVVIRIVIRTIDILALAYNWLTIKLY